MPPQETKQPAVDLDALAKQFGGQSPPPASGVNLDELAKQFGGSSQPAPRQPAKLTQPIAKPPATPNTPENMLGSFNAGLAPYGAAALVGAPFGPVGMGLTTGALGAADLVSMGYNAFLSPLFGTPQIGTPSETIRNQLVNLMPNALRMPQTAEQRMAFGTGSGMGSAMNMGSALGGAALATSGGVKNVLTQMAGTPSMNALTGATSGVAAQAAAEMGAPPLVQVGAGFVGGLGGALTAQGVKSGVSAVLNPKPSQAQLSTELAKRVEDAYQGMENAGVRYSTTSVRALLDDMLDSLPGIGHQLTPPDIAQAIRALRAELGTVKGGVLGPKALNDLGKLLDNSVNDNATSGRIVGHFKSMIDDFIGDSASSVTAKRANVSVMRSELNDAVDKLNSMTPSTPQYVAQQQVVKKLTARNDTAITNWAKQDPATQRALTKKNAADEELKKLITLQGRGSASQKEVDKAQLAVQQAETKLANAIESVAPSDATAIKSAQEALNLQNKLRVISNDLAQRNFRSKELDKIMSDVDIAAEAGRTVSTEIRNRLKALLSNKKFNDYATDDQKKMLRDAMRGSFASRTSEAVGALSPSLRSAGGFLGSALGLGGINAGMPMAAAVPLVVAPVAKETANMMARSRLGDAARRIKTGEPAPTFVEKNLQKIRSGTAAIGTQRSSAPTEESRTEAEIKKLRTTKQPIPASVTSGLDNFEQFAYEMDSLKYLADSILTDDKVASLYNLDDLKKLNELLWANGALAYANDIAVFHNEKKAAQ